MLRARSFVAALLPLALAAALPAHASPLEISVDSGVLEVHLVCGGETHIAKVVGGIAKYDFNPVGCKVKLVYGSGQVDGTGSFRCDRTGCTLVEVDHRPFSDSDGVINFLFVEELGSTTLELTCPGGYRNRASIDRRVATFRDVPKDVCSLSFKGGIAAKFNRAEWGSYRCTVQPPVANCTPTTP